MSRHWVAFIIVCLFKKITASSRQQLEQVPWIDSDSLVSAADIIAPILQMRKMQLWEIKVSFPGSGWTRIHPSFLCSESRHDYGTVPSVSLQRTEAELKLMWAKRLDVAKAQSRFLLQVGQDSLSPGSSCCLCCSGWASPGLALRCLYLHVGSPGGSLWRLLTAGSRSGKRAFFPQRHKVWE